MTLRYEESDMHEEQPSFMEIMDTLFGAEEVKIPQLFRLSDMAADEYDVFTTCWAAASDERRRVIARHMADLTETNFEVEFAPVFKQFLADDSEDVVLAALDGLWDSTNIAVVSPIIRLMQGRNNSAEIRCAAAATLAHYVLLGEWGQVSGSVKERAVDALLAEHKNSDNPLALRRATLESLGASSHDEVPGLIAEAYEDEDRGLQMSAMFAMGNSADPRWLHTIVAEMESPFYDMRAEAARAAGELASSDAISSLADLLYDSEQDVQVAAVEALGKIGGDRATDVLTQVRDDEEMTHLTEAIKQALAGDDLMSAIDLDLFDDEFDDYELLNEELDHDYDDEYDYKE